MSKYEDPQMPNKSDGRTYDPALDMPNKGTKTGFIPGLGGAFGADVGPNADNIAGSFGRSTDSDPMDKCFQDAGDYKAANQPGRRSPEPAGKSITAACDSDAKADETPKDQRY